uniref:Ovule protein n=1 Tax=Haemonchus contortus TaxID=6289 RepID=A0A7I4Y087_HAECO
MRENSLSLKGSQKEVLYDDYSDTTEEYGRRLSCSWLPCCMDEDEAESFGHHVLYFYGGPSRICHVLLCDPHTCFWFFY